MEEKILTTKKNGMAVLILQRLQSVSCHLSL